MLVERVIDAFQANAAALGQAEKIINEKQASDQQYMELIPKVVEICTKTGKIDDTPEEKQALASMLSSPVGALDVIAKLAAFVDTNVGNIGSQQVDSRGRVIHNQTKQASYNSLNSPYVGRRTSEKSASWEALERGLNLV